MWFNRQFFFIFMSYSTLRNCVVANKASVFETLVEKTGIQSGGGDNGTSSIVLINGQNYEIFDLDKNSATDLGFHPQITLNKFFICMNCMFATWTRGELFKLIEFFPIMYSRNLVMQNTHIFIEKFIDIDKILQSMSNKVKEFISILFNFFDINTYSTYLDTSILKALLSLNFKTDYFQLLNLLFVNDKPTYRQFPFDNNVVKLVMEIVNDLQIFITANCKISENIDSKTFFPYVEPDPLRIDITQFLKDIKPLKLEPSIEEVCSTDKMQLLTLLFLLDQKNLLHGLAYMTYNAGCDKKLQFTQVMTLLKISHDPEISHWFQETIMNTIISLLFIKTKKFFTSYDFNSPKPPNIMKQFKIINSEFLSAYNTLPQKIIDCFELLASKEKYDITDSERFTGENNVIADLKPILEFNTYTNEEENPKLHAALESSTLEEFLEFLVDYVKYFKCFLQSFKFLNKEYNTYYMPFKKDYNSIIDSILYSLLCEWNSEKPSSVTRPIILSFNSYKNFFTQNMKYTKNHKRNDLINKRDTHIAFNSDTIVNKKYNLRYEGCNFFTALAYNCLDALRYINRASMTGSQEDLKLSRNQLDKIKTYLNEAHKNYFNYVLQSTVYNTKPYFDIHINRNNEFFDLKFLHRRNMHILALELNYYGLNNCHPPIHDFLTYNNIHEFGDSNYYDDVIRKYFQRVNITRQLELTDCESLETHNTIDLSDIYDEYFNKSEVYDAFSEALSFKWKGEGHRNIKEIYNDIVFNVTKPFYYYAFADVFVKFSLGALFYIVDYYYRGPNLNLSAVQCNDFLSMYKNVRFMENLNFSRFIFPKLTNYISEETVIIHKYLCENDKEKEKSKIDQIRQKIVDEFQKIGVSIVLISQESPTSTDTSNDQQNKSESEKTQNSAVDKDNINSQTKVVDDSKERITTITFFLRTISLIDKTLSEYTTHIYS